MKEGPDISRLAALIGDPARANMLAALMDGRALTASELASVAGIAAPTASSHLAKLEAGGLLQRRRQGRHRYFALQGDEVARVLESLMGLAARQGAGRRPGPKDPALRKARVCYNHLAGDKGTRLYASLIGAGHLAAAGQGLALTPAGRDAMDRFGIALAPLDAARAPLCRECLDWSERRSHLAGSLGRALLARLEGLGWARRDPASRAIHFSRAGEAAFDRAFPTAAA
jgi:DNA-binding transcriptional ArsR family regulator